MLTLAFDTASKTASVALLREHDVLYDTIINKGLNHSEVLLPAIDEAFRLSNIKLKDIDFFACTLGPGSFTGLRIGVSTLKGLMMATGKPAAGVSSLAALALNVKTKGKIIGSVMDAGRGQVYLAYYQYDQDGVLRQIAPEQILDPKDIIHPYQEEVIYVGDGAIQHADRFISIGKRSQIASVEQQFIGASAVGVLAMEKYRSKDFLDLASCVPVYLRSADAELKKRNFI